MPSRVTAEPRRDLPVPLPVHIRRRGGADAVEYALNLSAGGLCLHLREPVSVGDTLEVSFELPAQAALVRARARVIWLAREEERGTHARFYETGLRFEDLPEPDRERIRRFVAQCREEAARGGA